MADQRKKKKAVPRGVPLTLTERLLALVYAKGLEPTQAAVGLAGAGLTHPQISTLLGKSADAVQKAVERARKGGKKKNGEAKQRGNRGHRK